MHAFESSCNSYRSHELVSELDRVCPLEEAIRSLFERTDERNECDRLSHAKKARGVCPAQRRIVLRSRGTRLRHVVAKMAGSVATVQRLGDNEAPQGEPLGFGRFDLQFVGRTIAVSGSVGSDPRFTDESLTSLSGKDRMDPIRPARVVATQRPALPLSESSFGRHSRTLGHQGGE